MASGTTFLHTNNVHLDNFWCPATRTCVSWGPDNIAVCPLRSRHIQCMSSVVTLNYVCTLWSRAKYPGAYSTGEPRLQHLQNCFLPNLTTSVVYLRGKKFKLDIWESYQTPPYPSTCTFNNYQIILICLQNISPVFPPSLCPSWTTPLSFPPWSILYSHFLPGLPTCILSFFQSIALIKISQWLSTVLNP